MKLAINELKKIIREEIFNILENKKYGGKEPDFKNWSEKRTKKYWNDMGGTFDKVLIKVKKAGFAKDPEAFVSTLNKKIKGKWPTEKK